MRSGWRGDSFLSKASKNSRLQKKLKASGPRPPRTPELESALQLRWEAGALLQALNPLRLSNVGAPPPPCSSPRRRGHFHRRALRVSFLLGALPATVPSRSSWPVLRGPLLLLGLASSGTSYYPLHGARYCPHIDRTPPLSSVLGSLAGPRVCLPFTRICATWVQWKRKKLWRPRHGGLV